jgi:hypothetical protein
VNVYLEAARLIAEGEVDHRLGACVAISRAASGANINYLPVTERFYTFRPRHGSSIYWLSSIGKSGRLTALCFAAAMHDTGDL